MADELTIENTKPLKNAWGIPKSSETFNDGPSLADVMSEQLASKLMNEELGLRDHVSQTDKVADETVNSEPVVSEQDLIHEFDQEYINDLKIAQALQKQFDQEYDESIQTEERHHNGQSKLTVSYSHYRTTLQPDWTDSEDDDEYFTMDDRKRNVDVYEEKDKELGLLPRCGYRKVGTEYITKHDKEISQRSNGRRIMEFPPGIETGDGGKFEMKVSNPVYNKIRNFSIKEGKRMIKVKDKEDKATSDQAVDQQTRVLLLKMVNNEILENFNGVISTGKEAVILHAFGGSGANVEQNGIRDIPKECAVKVFKTSLSTFKTRDKYIKDDHRFKDRFGKQNPRKIVHIWAEKELHNLLRMYSNGINVPQPVFLKNHVLVMAFIGENATPAPKIKDALLSKQDIKNAYHQVKTTMIKLYNECKLVHADLSEYNILWHNNECWFIDVSQSVEPNHSNGLEFLMRDCLNVINFFNKKDLNDIETAQQLFSLITGLHLDENQTEAEIFGQVRKYQKESQIMINDISEEDKFDYCWDKSKKKPENSKAIDIPESKAYKDKYGKTPKYLKNYPTPSKSPKSPSLAGMSDEQLKSWKESLLKSRQEANSQPHQPTKITFEKN